METVEIQTITADGYERTALVSMVGKDRSVWCHFIEHDEYMEGGNPVKRKTGDRMRGQLSIQLVNGFTPLAKGTILGFSQPVNESPHVVAQGLVKEVTDEYTCICDFGALGKAVPVEFEDSVEVETGRFIQVSGSLEFELE